MTATKKASSQPQSRFFQIARLERQLSSYVIAVFIVCYVSGAFLHFGAGVTGYLKAAVLNSGLFGLFAIVREIVRARKRRATAKPLLKVLLFFVIFFVAGYLEYFVINRQNLYWIILVVIVTALTWSVFEFAIELKSIWHGTIKSREKSLVQFIYLYATTMFSFAFLYTILNSWRPMFALTYQSNPFFDFLYLSVITVSTLGYGDIIPMTALAKFLVMCQTIIGYLFLYIFLGLVVSWMGKSGK